MWKLKVTVSPRKLEPDPFEFQTDDEAWLFVAEMLENGLRFHSEDDGETLIPPHSLGPFQVWEEPE